MNKSTVISLQDRDQIADSFTDLLRTGARKLLEQAIHAELEELLSHYTGQQTDTGYATVVRNGYLPERAIQTGIGPVTVKVPKVRSRTGEPITFHSALVPPYLRKTRSLEAAIPWLYLKGVSSGEMGEALKVLVGPDAEGLSASTVSRLKQVWAQEYQDWCATRLDKDRWVYLWVDGIYSGLRAEQAKLCALVPIPLKMTGHSGERDRLHIAKTLEGYFYTNRSRSVNFVSGFSH